MVIGALVAVALIATGVFVVRAMQAGHDKTNFDQAYKAQALKAPFTLTKQSWDSQTQQWTYEYTAALSVAAAITELQHQLSGGGYQTVVSLPDDTSPAHPLIHRDLITGGISLSATAAPDPAQSGATVTAGPVEVMVTVSQLAQN
jgi:hypothetical protein